MKEQEAAWAVHLELSDGAGAEGDGVDGTEGLSVGDGGAGDAGEGAGPEPPAH